MIKTLAKFLFVLFVWNVGFQALGQVPLRPESELIKLLESIAPSADKAIACKELAVVGTDASVPPLAKLLGNPELSSWARIALEANSSQTASEALRNAAKSLEGRLLVGVINSIGVRRDEAAIELLTGFLRSREIELSEAASIALGRIGNSAAGKLLLAEMTNADAAHREAVAQGCIRCADRLIASEQASDAIALFDVVRTADVSIHRRCEAIRGTILARKSEGLPLLVESLKNEDKRIFETGLSAIRDMAATHVAKNVFDVIKTSESHRAALMIRALADRNDPEVLPMLAETAENGSIPVRLAAIQALGEIGNASALESLLAISLENQPELAAAALTSLAQLPAQGVNEKLASMLPAAEGDQRLLLLELIARRRIPATQELIKSVASSDRRVYLAALKAMGETVELKDLSLLIEEVLKPKFDAPEIEEQSRQAIRIAATRMPDRDACVGVLDKSLEAAPLAIKQFLLEVIADVGGNKALQVVNASARSSDSKLQDTGSRLLGKWSSLDAADTLLDYAKTGPTAQFRSRALKGFISLARRFSMSEPDRVEMCRAAINASSQTAERTLVLDVLKLHPSPQAFALAMELSERDDLKNEALSVGVAIAQSLGGQGVDLDLMKKAIGGRSVKLEVVKAQYGAGSNWSDVTEHLQRNVNGTTWIALSNSNYNQAFGGDPAPGTVKQLKVQFRMDGKPGEATFSENQLLIFPDPK